MYAHGDELIGLEVRITQVFELSDIVDRDVVNAHGDELVLHWSCRRVYGATSARLAHRRLSRDR